MKQKHFFAPDTVVHMPAPRKRPRLRLLWGCGIAALVLVYLVWFWHAVFSWVARLMEGWL